MTAATPPANFDHLLRLTDRRGTFEHACFAEPRPEHGYCTDDMARVLVVATREPDTDGPVNGLAGLAMRFLNEAQAYAVHAEIGWTASAVGRTSRPRTTTGADASGGSVPQPPTVT